MLKQQTMFDDAAVIRTDTSTQSSLIVFTMKMEACDAHNYVTAIDSAKHVIYVDKADAQSIKRSLITRAANSAKYRQTLFIILM